MHVLFETRISMRKNGNYATSEIEHHTFVIIIAAPNGYITISEYAPVCKAEIDHIRNSAHAKAIDLAEKLGCDLREYWLKEKITRTWEKIPKQL